MHAREVKTNRIICAAIVSILIIGIACTLVLRAYLSGQTSGKDSEPASVPIADLSKEQFCGPLSLHAAASMLGAQTDLPEIIEACKPLPKGVSMATLQKVARKLGLDTKGYKMTWEKLLELKSPAILYLNRRHFVTVYPSQYTPASPGEGIRVFDSDKAPEWWSQAKAEDSWSGEVLVVAGPRRVKRAREARVKFDCLVHDLGDVRVPLDKKLDVQLIFENIGAKPLKISRVKTSCGCAKIGTPSEAIQSGERGKIDLAVDLDKARGAFNYVVVIETNDPMAPMLKARITGRAFNTQLTTRKELFLTSIARGGRTSKSFVLRDPGDGSLKQLHPGIGLSVSPAELAGDNGDVSVKATWSPFDKSKHQHMRAAEDDVIIEVVATASESAPMGEFDGTLEITTEIPNNEQIQVNIHGLVVSNIIAKPSALFFSTAGTQSTFKTVAIESRIGRPLDLQDITVPPNLPLKIEKQTEPSKPILLSVHCSHSGTAGSTITGDIVCSFADETVLRIPVIIH